jgi:hypothetical protein
LLRIGASPEENLVQKTDKALVGGILGFLLLGGLCLCCFGGVAFLPYRWFGAISGPVGVAKDFLRKDPKVLEHLGRDLKFDVMPSGSVSEQNGVGKATLSLRVKGSKAKGEARVELAKARDAGWVVVAAELKVGSETVPLKGNPSGGAFPPPEPPPGGAMPEDPGAGKTSGESVDA